MLLYEFRLKVSLFQGKVPGATYFGKELRTGIEKSCILAKLNKFITLHWLQYSYATYLFENSTYLRYIL